MALQQFGTSCHSVLDFLWVLRKLIFFLLFTYFLDLLLLLLCSHTFVVDSRGKPKEQATLLNDNHAIYHLVTDRNPGPAISRPFYSDYYPGNFQEQTGINRDHFYKSIICSRL